MRRLASLALAVALAGCSARAQFQIGSGTLGAPSAGSSVVSSSSGLQIQGGGSALGTLLAIGVLAAASYQDEALRGRPGAFRPEPGEAPGRTPAMAQDRRINEQDCTAPIADWSANLKCR